MKWVRITDVRNIPAREGRAVQISSTSIAVFNLDGRFVALENRCPHKGGPLADGIVGAGTVTCPLHNWRVSLESGRVTKPCDGEDLSVRTFDVRVENGVLMLSLEAMETAAA